MTHGLLASRLAQRVTLDVSLGDVVQGHESDIGLQKMTPEDVQRFWSLLLLNDVKCVDQMRIFRQMVLHFAEGNGGAGWGRGWQKT